MNTPAPALDAAATRSLEHELDVVRAAIELVASGSFPRVTCAGLHFARELAEESAAMALAAGVRVLPLPTIDESPSGVIVELAPHG